MLVILSVVKCSYSLPYNQNIALNSSSEGYVLSLCPSEQYIIQAPILFAFPNQEISTLGYPTDDTRATLVVNGPVSDGTGHTTAVDGTCSTCSGVKLRNIQVCAVAPMSLVCSRLLTQPAIPTLDQWHASRRRTYKRRYVDAVFRHFPSSLSC